jgi:anti-sigma factor RsiW
MTVPDDELFAFVDGELPPEAMARITAAMETDPQLALRVETQRALRRLLSGAHAGAMEPPPRRLTIAVTGAEPPKPAARPAEVIAFPGAKAKEKAKAKTREAKPAKTADGAARRFQPWMAMAACLVAGLFIGRVAIPTLPSLSGAESVAPMAVGPLAQALSQQNSGVGNGPIRIGLSFQDKAGLYCRTFQASGQAPVSGVACREKAAWRLRVVSAAGPAAVRATVDAMIAGPPLDPAGEAKAKAAGWKVR